MQNHQMEHVHSKYPGTGSADTTKHEWNVHMARDSLSLLLSPGLAAYTSVGSNQSVKRMFVSSIERMVRPCGPPQKDDL